MADLNDLIDDEGPKLSRRNVVVGTAWAVPTIMAVGAAPAFAVSKLVSASVPNPGQDSKFALTVNITGWKSGDFVNVQSVTGDPAMTWNSSPLGNHTMIRNSIVIQGNIKLKANDPKVKYTVNFTVSGAAGSPNITGSTTFDF